MAPPVLKGPFTVESYQRLGELGILGEDDRVELIDGQVVEMSPIGGAHASCVRRLNHLLGQHRLEGAMIDVQNPVVLDEHNAPQPDLALLNLRADGYPGHPRAADTLLIIEIADSSLAYDRDMKIPRYARAGVPEAWLVDLTAGRIDVYQEPHAGCYARVRSAGPGEALTPSLLPDVTLAVTDILG